MEFYCTKYLNTSASPPSSRGVLSLLADLLLPEILRRVSVMQTSISVRITMSLLSLLLGIDRVPATLLIALGIWRSQKFGPGGGWWQVVLQQPHVPLLPIRKEVGVAPDEPDHAERTGIR